MSEASSKTTTELEVIQKWAEERDGKPSRVKSTADDEGGGLLRIDFPGYSGKDSLEEISWDDWYKTFQERNLEFLYQEHTAGGKESRFFKLISKEKEEEKNEQKAEKDKQKEKEKPASKKKEEKDVKEKDKQKEEKSKEKKKSK